MKPIFYSAALTAVSAVFLTGCVDNNYDLSDIDTTTEIKIDHLVLPVQIDPVELSSFIKVEEGDKIKEVTINGKTFYAVEETGDYHSDPIHINKFDIHPDNLNPTEANFNMDVASGSRKARRSNDVEIRYTLHDAVNNSIHYNATGIDSSIHDVTWMHISPLNFEINLSMKGGVSNAVSTLENVVIELPVGLGVTSITAPGYTFRKNDYNIATGKVTLTKVDLTNNKAKIVVSANELDLNPATYPVYRGAFNYNTHSFKLDSHFNLLESKLVMKIPGTQVSGMPSMVSFDVTYALNSVSIERMLGEVSYDLTGEGLNIDPINIDDLPDFLADENTNLILANPQIYLNINNPVGREGLVYSSGLEIKALRDGVVDASFPLNAFTVPSDQGEGPYNFVLAPYPNKVSEVPDEFKSDLYRVEYPNINYLLSGAGLPNTLDLALVNPQIPTQSLTSPLEIGRDIPGLEGTYRFLAPLALQGDGTTGSVVYYNDVSDGWNDDTMDDMKISLLEITAVASSTLPLGAELKVYALDVEGKRMKNVNITPAVVPADAKNVPIQCRLEGVIEHLDGIEYVAEVRPNGSEETLAPTQSITLTNLKATVTGSYTKKF